MRKISLIIIVLLLLSAVSALAQVRMPSRREGTPFGRNVTGFMQLAFGASAMPILNLNTEAKESETGFEMRNGRSKIPGFTAEMFFIPTWGHNGITFGASYDITGGRFDQTVDTKSETYEGDSNVGMAAFTLRLGYVRYFGDHEWHPFVLTDLGLVWETILVESSYKNADDEVKEAKANSGLVCAGFGIGREITSGMIGLEMRTDYYPFAVTGKFNHPAGEFDLEVEHPLIFKLNLFFSMGQL